MACLLDRTNADGFAPQGDKTVGFAFPRTMRRSLWLVWLGVLLLLLLFCPLAGWRVLAAGTAAAAGAEASFPQPESSSVTAAAPAPSTLNLVWVNTRSRIYHYPGSRFYGATAQGKYLGEAQAIAEGNRPAQNERRPPNFAASEAAAAPVVGPVVPASPPTPGGVPAAAAAAPAPAPSPPPPPSAATPSASAATIATPAATMLPAAGSSPPAPATEEAWPANDEAAAKEQRLAVCIQAIAAQSDPARLATLGERGANPRLKRIVYYLAQARAAAGADPAEVIEQAQKQNGSAGTPRAPLVKASLLRNLKISDGLGLLTPANLPGLRRGQAPTITRGPYTGQRAEVDHIVPLAHAPEIGNELANLELLPAALNRAKLDKVGERQLALARKFRAAGLISEATLAAVQARFQPSGTARYELPEP